MALKLISFMNRGSTVGAVNVPEINVSRALGKGNSRILSFHRNTPGGVWGRVGGELAHPPSGFPQVC